MKNLSDSFEEEIKDYEKTLSTLREILPTDTLIEIELVLERLKKMRVSIAVFGEVNSGKSSLLNSLMGLDNNNREECLFTSNDAVGTWSDEASLSNGVIWKKLESIEIEIYDTPGIARDFLNHMAITKKITSNSDVILYVVSEQITDEGLRELALEELLKSNKPFILVVNKIDTKRPSEIEALIQNVKNRTKIAEEKIVKTAGFPINGNPIVHELIDKISSVVVSEKLALVNETIKNKINKGLDYFHDYAKRKIEEEERKQNRAISAKNKQITKIKFETDRLIKNYAKGAAASAAIIPFGIDAVTSTIISGGMFNHIANKYGIKFDGNAIVKLIRSLISAFYSILFVSTATLLGYQALAKGAKTNPITYVIGMALDGVFTYFIVTALGQTFSFYCANNLSWGAKETAANAIDLFVHEYQ